MSGGLVIFIIGCLLLYSSSEDKKKEDKVKLLEERISKLEESQ